MTLFEMKIGEQTFAPRVIPTLLAALMLATTIGLGLWQLHRAEWKGMLIRDWEQKSQEAPLDELPPAESASDLTFRKAKLLGRYLSDKSIHLVPRAHNGQAGYELITPLKMVSGETVLVDRGFVADNSKEGVDQPIGAVFVEGELRFMPERGWMQPANDPAKDQWFWLDAEAMNEAKQLDSVYPLMLLAQSKALNTAWPVAKEPGQPYANNHMTYAFIWFSLALASVVIYALSQMKKDQA